MFSAFTEQLPPVFPRKTKFPSSSRLENNILLPKILQKATNTTVAQIFKYASIRLTIREQKNSFQFFRAAVATLVLPLVSPLHLFQLFFFVPKEENSTNSLCTERTRVVGSFVVETESRGNRERK